MPKLITRGVSLNRKSQWWFNEHCSVPITRGGERKCSSMAVGKGKKGETGAIG